MIDNTDQKKLIQLLRSNDKTFITLALELEKGTGIDLSDYWAKVKRIGELLPDNWYSLRNRKKENYDFEDALEIISMPEIWVGDRYVQHQNQAELSELLILFSEVRLVKKINFFNARFWYFPKEIFLFKELEWLDLSNLWAELPNEGWELLPNLHTLILEENSLSNLPKNLTTLSNLRVLYLDKNHFTTIPKTLQKLLPQLEQLTTYYNPLSDKAKAILAKYGF